MDSVGKNLFCVLPENIIKFRSFNVYQMCATQNANHLCPGYVRSRSSHRLQPFYSPLLAAETIVSLSINQLAYRGAVIACGFFSASDNFCSSSLERKHI